MGTVGGTKRYCWWYKKAQLVVQKDPLDGTFGAEKVSKLQAYRI